jgi:hypothetical protein
MLTLFVHYFSAGGEGRGFKKFSGAEYFFGETRRVLAHTN